MVTWTGEGQTYSWDEILDAFPPKEKEISSSSGESDDPQTEIEWEHIIETAGEGLHGAINKYSVGLKLNGMGWLNQFMVFYCLYKKLVCFLCDKAR